MSKSTSDCCATGCKRLWPKVRLGDVCEIVLGGTPSTKVDKYWDGDIPWLTPGDMGKMAGMYVSDTKRKITKDGLDAGSSLFPARSIILSTRAPIGYVFINNVPMCTNQGCKTLVPKGCVWPEYLCLNLIGRTEELNRLGTGTTFKELATGRLRDIEIPLPPLAEQKKIVEKVEKVLKRVDALKAQFERMEKSAADYFKAALAETFAAVKGEKVKLGDVCGLVGGFAFRSSDYSSSEKYKVVNIGCVKNCFFDVSCAKQIDFIPAEMPVRCVLKKGDLLTSLTGNIGRVCFVDIDNGLLNQRVAKLDVNASRISKKYLFYLFQTKSFVSALSALSFGSAQQNISPIKMAGIDMMLPTMAAQEDAVSALDAAKVKSERMVVAARRGVEICGKMRKAILAEAFQ